MPSEALRGQARTLRGSRLERRTIGVRAAVLRIVIVIRSPPHAVQDELGFAVDAFRGPTIINQGDADAVDEAGFV